MVNQKDQLISVYHMLYRVGMGSHSIVMSALMQSTSGGVCYPHESDEDQDMAVSPGKSIFRN